MEKELETGIYTREDWEEATLKMLNSLLEKMIFDENDYFDVSYEASKILNIYKNNKIYNGGFKSLALVIADMLDAYDDNDEVWLEIEAALGNALKNSEKSRVTEVA
jgi:hypothetical protein